jgi:hypothetical protein
MKINELKSQTYRSASIKADRVGQKNLALRFKEYANKVEEEESKIKDSWFKYPFMKEFKFDIFINFTLGREYLDEEDEIYPKKVVKNVVFYNYSIHESVQMEIFGHCEEGYYISCNIIIDEVNNKAQIILFDENNKFTSRRDAIKFMKMLKMLYYRGNPNISKNIISKINKSEVSDIAPDLNRDTLWDFLEYNGKSWEDFIKDINIRKLWDYPPIEEVNESKKQPGEKTKSGKHVPKKYLTKNKSAMKKEIDEFRGKDNYKKNWDADYKSGKGGKGKRYETKKSDATKAYEKKFGKKSTLGESKILKYEDYKILEKSNIDTTLKNKSEDSGIPVTILRQVYNRGKAAWNSGHRPGSSQDQWAIGRVNSFITGSGGARKADSDLWKKAKEAKKKKK